MKLKVLLCSWKKRRKINYASYIKLHKKVIKFSSSKNCSWISLTDTWQHFHLHVYCLHDCAVRVHVHVYIATYLLTARIVVCQTEACCRGFYGAECYACPGGFKTPCSEHGQVWIIREYRSLHSYCLHTSRRRLKYCLVLPRSWTCYDVIWKIQQSAQYSIIH